MQKRLQQEVAIYTIIKTTTLSVTQAVLVTGWPVIQTGWPVTVGVVKVGVVDMVQYAER